MLGRYLSDIQYKWGSLLDKLYDLLDLQNRFNMFTNFQKAAPSLLKVAEILGRYSLEIKYSCEYLRHLFLFLFFYV